MLGNDEGVLMQIGLRLNTNHHNGTEIKVRPLCMKTVISVGMLCQQDIVLNEKLLLVERYIHIQMKAKILCVSSGFVN